MPAYGKLLCTHQEKVTWKYVRCPEHKCILFVIINIAKRIVMDLVHVAMRRPRLKKHPKRTDKVNKRVDSYWCNKIAIYLLFVLQSVKFLQLRKEKKYNILYQCGYDDISLIELFSISEKDSFALLPYWITIPRLSRKQLLLLVDHLNIEIKETDKRSKQSLIYILLEVYKKWMEVLSNTSTTILNLQLTFSNISPFSNDLRKAKSEIREKIQVIKPGCECMINWITTGKNGFCPIKKQTPGPQTHRLLITSWLHRCGLLHEKNKADIRQTRVFSDNDCRTTGLHLRRDCGEDTLTLCKQMGWKVPPGKSDTGSVVYRRCEAVVTSNEYNSRLISWLQLLCEGRLVAKASINWCAVIETARIHWLQLMKRKELDKTKPEQTEKSRGRLQEIIQRKLSVNRLKGVEARLEVIENTLTDISHMVGVNMNNFAEDISKIVLESLKSGEDAGQKYVSKMKKRKFNH